MSFDALAWAAKQKPGNLAAKMVLLALANYADENGCAYPSTAAVAEFGDMNHKTATVALDRLEALGLIIDSGKRAGRSGQIKVYRLNLQSPNLSRDAPVPGQHYYTYTLTNPETGEYYIGQRSCGCLPENDRYMGSGLWPKRMAAEGVSLQKAILDTYADPASCAIAERAFIEEAASDDLCRNVEFKTPKNTPPKTGALISKPPVFSEQDPQKRVTDTITEPVSQKTSSSSNKRAAKPQDEFPAPDGITDQQWADLLANRKAKRAAMSPTAYRAICNKLTDLQRPGWPPGRIIDVAIERGWTTVFETDEMKGVQHGQQFESSRRQAGSGGRPSGWLS